jgi:ABC-type transport system involved in cytochrome c biogenesis permease subunit
MRSLTRVTFLLGCVAAGLTAIGIILAMFWARTEWGRYWAWDEKEIGAFVVIVWQLCFLFCPPV